MHRISIGKFQIECARLVNCLKYPASLSSGENKLYNRYIGRAKNAFSKLDAIVIKIPIYKNKTDGAYRLQEILDEYDYMFKYETLPNYYFPNIEQHKDIAEVYEKFSRILMISSSTKNFTPSGTMKLSYEVISDSEKCFILCEKYHFDTF